MMQRPVMGLLHAGGDRDQTRETMMSFMPLSGVTGSPPGRFPPLVSPSLRPFPYLHDGPAVLTGRGAQPVVVVARVLAG